MKTYSGTPADFARVVSLIDKEFHEFDEADRAQFLKLEFQLLRLIQTDRWPKDGPDIATVLMREINALPTDVEHTDEAFYDAVLKGLVPLLFFSVARFEKMSPEQFRCYCVSTLEQ